MVDVTRATGLDEAAQRWRDTDIKPLLAEAAPAVGAGSPTDAGLPWTLPTSDFKPIELAGGIPDPARLPDAEARPARETDTPEPPSKES